MAITRRDFLTMAGTAAFALKGSSALRTPIDGSRFAFIAAGGVASGVYVYALHDPDWTLRHFFPAEEPVALAVHPDRRTLYVLHNVGIYRMLPRGYVSAYRVNTQSGKATLLGIEPLSLSATFPLHFAIAPDGKSLIVSAQGGGLYNWLPILSDGSVGRVCGIRKEVGCSSIAQYGYAARPRAVIFNKGGTAVLTVDQGNDTISIFDPGPSMRVLTRAVLPAGTGPISLAAYHPSGVVFVSGSRSCRLLSLQYDASTASISQPVAQLQERIRGSVSVHPTLKILYGVTARGLGVYRFGGVEGVVRVQHFEIEDLMLEPQQPYVSAELEALFLTTREGLLRLTMNRVFGYLNSPQLVGAVPFAQSAAFI